MAVSKATFVILAAIIVVVAAALPFAQANSMAPAPAPSTNDGTTVDQGIAYVLMFLALVLTYIIHTMDASFGF